MWQFLTDSRSGGCLYLCLCLLRVFLSRAAVVSLSVCVSVLDVLVLGSVS